MRFALGYALFVATCVLWLAMTLEAPAHPKSAHHCHPEASQDGCGS